MIVSDSPVPELLQRAVAWLAHNAHDNLGTEVVLRNLSPGRDWSITAVRTGSTFQGISVVNPSGMWFFEATAPAVAETLVALVRAHRTPRKLTLSGRIKPWIRDMLLENWTLTREHDLVAMTCTSVACAAHGRWATAADIPALQAYQVAYNEERRGAARPDFASLVARRQVAVLAGEEGLISVVKRSGETTRYACLAGIWTPPEARRQGRAASLTSFLVRELLAERPAVHLIADDDNLPALALYRSLGFQEVGLCYMAYLQRSG